MTEDERDRFVFTVVRGMTPRQVIAVGAIFRAVFARDNALEKKATLPHSKENDGIVVLAEREATYREDMASDLLVRYLRAANQSPDPTPASVTPVAGQPPRQP